MTSIARVALPIPRREPFDYRIPSALVDQVRPGVQVRVPFGPSKRIGWVVEITDHSPHPRLRDLDSVVADSAAIEPDLLELLKWTADYYLCGIGEVIECAVPKSVRNRKARTVRWVRLTSEEVAKEPSGATSEPRQKVLDHQQQQEKGPR